MKYLLLFTLVLIPLERSHAATAFYGSWEQHYTERSNKISVIYTFTPSGVVLIHSLVNGKQKGVVKRYFVIKNQQVYIVPKQHDTINAHTPYYQLIECTESFLILKLFREGTNSSQGIKMKLFKAVTPA